MLHLFIRTVSQNLMQAQECLIKTRSLGFHYITIIYNVRVRDNFSILVSLKLLQFIQWLINAQTTFLKLLSMCRLKTSTSLGAFSLSASLLKLCTQFYSGLLQCSPMSALLHFEATRLEPRSCNVQHHEGDFFQ